VGVYAAMLAKHFAEVYTFEPDPTNFACLSRNLANRAPNVRYYESALGAEEGSCDVYEVEQGNCGAHKVGVRVDDDGIPVTTIDTLDLSPSLIWLDIEGHELEALKGAQRTLARCSPTIILEVKGLGENPTAWLEARGYTERSRLGRDILYKRDA